MTPTVLPSAGEIKALLEGSDRGPLKAKDVARALDVEPSAYTELKELLRSLAASGELYRVKGNRYALPRKINLAVGRLSVTRRGDGFVVTETPGEEDVFVPGTQLGSAMDGDQVVARIEGHPRGRNPVGRVIKVLERAHATIVGTYRSERGLGYVVPDDPALKRDVLVPTGSEGDARPDDVVVLEVVHFGDAKLSPLGEVVEVLGPRSEPGVDVLAILYGHGLPLRFPPEVEEAAERVVTAAPEDGGARTDRRDLRAFTIDPADAKDHDDALSIRPVDGGVWEVGIHIADVSFYVERGGAIDLEALQRGTSVYLVDRVVPMLPAVLSGDRCSLRPDEDRRALSLFVVLDAEGRVRKHRFERTWIRSRHRLTYVQVEDVLDGRDRIDDATDAALHQLDQLARILRRRRKERGSIDFDLPEARVVLDEEGAPVDIQRAQRLESHRLIEDFMLLANEVVAAEAERRRLPVLFRIHEPPAPDRMDRLRTFLASVGHSLRRGEVEPLDLARVLERVEGSAQEGLVSTVILRSMKRARYSAVNRGHFGLAADRYLHFTSPIRRYPDLLTHRVIVRALVEGRSIPADWFGEELEAVAERSSRREEKATAAERDSVDLKKVEFMERHLGDSFDGSISSVTAFGFFVLLDDFFVEGLVHVNSLDDDYYEFREDVYSLVGARKGRRFRLGDRVSVQVARADRESRQIDFILLSTRRGR